jgi:hypothetical protein
MDIPDPFVLAFKLIVHCEPINNYIIDMMNNMITYYCGNNNRIIFPYLYIENLIKNNTHYLLSD